VVHETPHTNTDTDADYNARSDQTCDGNDSGEISSLAFTVDFRRDVAIYRKFVWKTIRAANLGVKGFVSQGDDIRRKVP
jgi:hypothetical protein